MVHFDLNKTPGSTSPLSDCTCGGWLQISKVVQDKTRQRKTRQDKKQQGKTRDEKKR
jgi:hypothetical protein